MWPFWAICRPVKGGEGEWETVGASCERGAIEEGQGEREGVEASMEGALLLRCRSSAMTGWVRPLDGSSIKRDLSQISGHQPLLVMHPRAREFEKE